MTRPTFATTDEYINSFPDGAVKDKLVEMRSIMVEAAPQFLFVSFCRKELMKGLVYKIKAKVWLWSGENPWYFVTIEKKDATQIKKEELWPRKGFGSIPVQVTIGKTTWKTSIFPEKKGTYLLPLKKEIRDKEGIEVGKTIEVKIEVLS